MYELDAATIGGWIGSLMWPFIRISSFFMVVPIIGTQLVPQRVRIILSLLVTILLVPHLPPVPAIDMVSLSAGLIVAQQILIGVAMALVLQFLLQVFITAGQIISMKMALGFATMVDPSSGVSVPVLSQFHLVLVTLLFLAMNGHLAMIDILVASFVALPVGFEGLTSGALYSLAGSVSWIIAGAMLISLPAITALLIVNITLGVMTRAAPQLNIFSIGFPFMLVLGLGIVWITVQGYLPHFERFTAEALEMMAELPSYK